MNSLRRQLALALLAGFALLLGAGGWAVYHFTSAALTRQFDQALFGKARTLTALVRYNRNRVEFDFPDRVVAQPGTVQVLEYFQLWKIGGEAVHRSFTLGSEDLPRRYGRLSQPDFFDLMLPGGIPGRGVGIRFPISSLPDSQRPGADGGVPEVGLVAAAGRYELDQQITTLSYTILASSAVTLLASLFLVDMILWGGLARLQRVADQARQIGAGSLQRRFPTGGMTKELAPICMALNELLGRLEGSFAELNQYAGKVAHELRTPLAILRLKIEQAGSRIAPDLAEELQAEIRQISHVVDQSLLIARAEQGREPAERQQFDLAQLLRDATEDFSLIASEAHRRVVLKVQPEAVNAFADPAHMRQIIHNLLSNAWKHGRGDIHVQLRLTPRNTSVLAIFNLISPRAPSGRVTLGLGLRVVDTLLGLHPEVKCRRQSGSRYYVVQLEFLRPPAGIPAD